MNSPLGAEVLEGVEEELKRPRADILLEPRGRPLFEAPLPGGRDLMPELYMLYSVTAKTNTKT